MMWKTGDTIIPQFHEEKSREGLMMDGKRGNASYGL
jgi:hypothetical protein